MQNIFPAVATGAFFGHAAQFCSRWLLSHSETSQTIRKKKKRKKDERWVGWQQSEEIKSSSSSLQSASFDWFFLPIYVFICTYRTAKTSENALSCWHCEARLSKAVSFQLLQHSSSILLILITIQLQGGDVCSLFAWTSNVQRRTEVNVFVHLNLLYTVVL